MGGGKVQGSREDLELGPEVHAGVHHGLGSALTTLG